jgi:hypothetical protein
MLEPRLTQPCEIGSWDIARQNLLPAPSCDESHGQETAPLQNRMLTRSSGAVGTYTG